jgi:hypothetical protein
MHRQREEKRPGSHISNGFSPCCYAFYLSFIPLGIHVLGEHLIY